MIQDYYINVVKTMNIKSERITLAMKNTNKKSKFKSKNVKNSFNGHRITKYAGLSPIMEFINHIKLGQHLNELFPTIMHNSTKFRNVHILLSVLLASLSGVNRLIKIATFTHDPLVMALLNLKKGMNKDVLAVRLKQMGQSGAIRLHEYLLGLTRQWLTKSQLTSITLDADSTVKTVYGNQQGAAKGYNPDKPGAKSYHPLLLFASELKLVLNSWFRTGSAYTSNGICELIKQTRSILPSQITHVFFRADSGFFNGALFDLLESFHWDYLVKVKLKNLNALLKNQCWQSLPGDPNIATCEFSYKGNGWSKPRTFRAIRTITEWVDAEFMGEKQLLPKYDYACYCSTLDGDALSLHLVYNQRATSETWIEQVKSQLFAGATLTNNFHANDILWQLSNLAYNLSVMMRFNMKTYWRQEHATFRDWFINIPARIVETGRQIKAKMYRHYYYKKRWLDFEQCLVIPSS